MIVRQSVNAAVHVAGGFAVGLLIASVAALVQERRRRDEGAPSDGAHD